MSEHLLFGSLFVVLAYQQWRLYRLGRQIRWLAGPRGPNSPFRVLPIKK